MYALDAVVDAERSKDGKRREERCQQDHRERESVHTQMERRTNRLVPDIRLFELEAGLVRVEAKPDNKRQH